MSVLSKEEVPPDIKLNNARASYEPGSRGTCITLQEIEEVLGIIASSGAAKDVTIGLGAHEYEVTVDQRVDSLRSTLGQTALQGVA